MNINPNQEFNHQEFQRIMGMLTSLAAPLSSLTDDLIPQISKEDKSSLASTLAQYQQKLTNSSAKVEQMMQLLQEGTKRKNEEQTTSYLNSKSLTRASKRNKKEKIVSSEDNNNHNDNSNSNSNSKSTKIRDHIMSLRSSISTAMELEEKNNSNFNTNYEYSNSNSNSKSSNHYYDNENALNPLSSLSSSKQRYRKISKNRNNNNNTNMNDSHYASGDVMMTPIEKGNRSTTPKAVEQSELNAFVEATKKLISLNKLDEKLIERIKWIAASIKNVQEMEMVTKELEQFPENLRVDLILVASRFPIDTRIEFFANLHQFIEKYVLIKVMESFTDQRLASFRLSDPESLAEIKELIAFSNVFSSNHEECFNLFGPQNQLLRQVSLQTVAGTRKNGLVHLSYILPLISGYGYDPLTICQLMPNISYDQHPEMEKTDQILSFLIKLSAVASQPHDKKRLFLKFITAENNLTLFDYLQDKSLTELQEIKDLAYRLKCVYKEKEHFIEALAKIPTDQRKSIVDSIIPFAQYVDNEHPIGLSKVIESVTAIPIEERKEILAKAERVYSHFFNIMRANKQARIKTLFELSLLKIIQEFSRKVAGEEEQSLSSSVLNSLSSSIPLTSLLSSIPPSCFLTPNSVIHFLSTIRNIPIRNDRVERRNALNNAVTFWKQKTQLFGQNFTSILKASGKVGDEGWNTLISLGNQLVSSFTFTKDNLVTYQVKKVGQLDYTGELLEQIVEIPAEKLILVTSEIQAATSGSPISEAQLVEMVMLALQLPYEKFPDYAKKIMTLPKEHNLPYAFFTSLDYKKQKYLINLMISLNLVSFHPQHLISLSRLFFYIPSEKSESVKEILKKWVCLEDFDYVRCVKILQRINPESQCKADLIIRANQISLPTFSEQMDFLDILTFVDSIIDLSKKQKLTDYIVNFYATFSSNRRKLFITNVRKLSYFLHEPYLCALANKPLNFEMIERTFLFTKEFDHSKEEVGFAVSALKVLEEISSVEEHLELIHHALPLFFFVISSKMRAELMQVIATVSRRDREDVIRRSKPFFEPDPAHGLKVIYDISSIPAEQREKILDQAHPYIEQYKFFGHRFIRIIALRKQASLDKAIDLLKSFSEITVNAYKNMAVYLFGRIHLFDLSTYEKFLNICRQELPHNFNSMIEFKFLFEKNPELLTGMHGHFHHVLNQETDLLIINDIALSITKGYPFFNLHPESPLVQQALIKLAHLNSDPSNPKNPMQIHEKLKLMNQENDPAVLLPREKIADKEVMINPKGFSARLQQKKQLTFSQIPRAFDFNAIQHLFEEIQTRLRDKQKGPALQTYLKESLEHPFEAIQGDFNHSFMEALAALTGKPHEIAPNDYLHFCAVMSYITDQPHQLEQGKLVTQREDVLLKMASSIAYCQKSEGLTLAYNLLPHKKYRQLDASIKDIPILEKAKVYLDTVIQKVLNNLFSNENALMASLTNIKGKVPQLAHHAIYLKNAIGTRVGLQHSLKFDTGSGSVVDHMLQLNLESLLKGFYAHALPHHFVKELQKSFSQDKESDEEKQLYSKLSHLIGSALSSDQIWELNEETGSPSLKERGALELLLKMGYLIEPQADLMQD